MSEATTTEKNLMEEDKPRKRYEAALSAYNENRFIGEPGFVVRRILEAADEVMPPLRVRHVVRPEISIGDENDE